MKFLRAPSFYAAIFAIFALAGCENLKKDKTLTWSVQKLYNEAKLNVSKGNYSTSRDYYNKLLARFPFGRYAQQSQLDLIQLEYKNGEFDAANAQADKFLQLYPTSPYADYARYMKGVVAYSRDTSLLDRLVPTNIAQSDQTMMKQAYDNFESLVQRSKDSDYAQDAKMRMLYLRNVSADHEIYVAEYYLRRGAYLAAAKRGQYVVDQFQTTPSTPAALAVMVRAYQEMNLPKLSADARRVLDTNFPNVASTNDRVDFILNGNIRKKKGFLRRITQNLVN